MKYFIYLCIGIWLLGASCAQAETKVGVVNIQKILESLRQKKQAEVAAEIAVKQSALNQQAQSLQAQVKRLEEQPIVGLSPQAKRDRLIAIAQQKRDNRTQIAQAATAIQVLQIIELPIKQLREIITQYGLENGYTLIIPMDMDLYGILYYDPLIDITAAIQRSLDVKK